MSHRSRLSSEVKMKAPFRVPASRRTVLIRIPPECVGSKRASVGDGGLATSGPRRAPPHANICSLKDLGLNTADPTTLVVDLNCAFASIEQQHDPALRGKPIAIGAYTVPSATM